MIKLTFLFFSLFFISPEVNIENNYLEIIKEEEVEIVEEIDIFQIIKKDDKYILSTNQKTWERELPSINNYKVLVKDNNCLIFYYQNNYLFLICYSPNGNILYNNKIINNEINERYDVYVNDLLYIVGSISRYTDSLFTNLKTDNLKLKDGFIITIDDNYVITNCKVYGGVLNEEFVEIVVSDSNIYLAGYKDPLSGGDFGNGGRYDNSVFVLKLNKDLTINTYQILSTNNQIILFDYYKDYLYLGLNNYLYKFDDNFNIIIKKLFEQEILFYKISTLNNVLCFTNNSGYLYDIFNFNILHQFNIEIINNDSKIKSFDKIIFINNPDKNYYFDIADMNNFIVFRKFYSGINPSEEINTLFGNAVFIEEIYEPNFNPIVYGFYNVTYVFKSQYGISFHFQRVLEVEKEVNVSEGFIYPIGYKLKFTGNGFLNGKNIINNYELQDDGDYILELVGNDGSKYSINFIVDKDQIKFNEISNHYWDIEASMNSNFHLDFTYNSEIDIPVNSVIINGHEYTDLIIDKDKKSIRVNMSLSEIGIKNLYIEYFTYFNNNDLKSIRIDEVVVVNVLKEAPNISINQIDELSLSVNLEDPLSTSRYFEIKATSSNHEVYQKYSLSNQNLTIYGLKENENYQILVTINYELGNGNILSYEIIQANIKGEDRIEIGEININKRSETLENFTLSLTNKEQFHQVLTNNQVIFENESSSTFNTFIYGIILLVLSAVLSFNLKIYLKKRNRNKKTMCS